MTTKLAQARINLIRERLILDPDAALEALVAIYSQQTDREQASAATIEDNGVGFTGVDAEILSSFAKQYQVRHRLSPKQLKLVMRKMPKYAGQIRQLGAVQPFSEESFKAVALKAFGTAQPDQELAFQQSFAFQVAQPIEIPAWMQGDDVLPVTTA